MDRNNRPLGRKKNVIGGSDTVGRPHNGGSGGGPNRGFGGGGNGGGPNLITIIIILAVVLLGGGGGLFSIFGGGGGSDSYVSDAVGSIGSVLGGSSSSGQSSGSSSSFGGTLGGSSLGGGSYSGGTLDTGVSPDARAKRVSLKGDGSDTTTVMIYLCGTDLESSGGYASKDLQEMTAANIGDNLNLLVFTGGCKNWQNNTISSNKNQIYQVKNGGVTRLWQSDTLKPMTDPKTLSDFISWAKANAPADRYDLIFWDHGGGSISGYGYDEMYPKSGSMTLDGIATALKNGGCTFDFVGFDACLMATLETALVVEPYADYLIASEETEPGCGWYYTDWLNTLSSDPSVSALQLGKQICDDFVRTCGRVAARQQATLSVIDLAELKGTVPDKFGQFALATAESIKNDDYQTIATARAGAKEFGKSSKIDQVDLIHLAEKIGSSEARTLASALDGAVKYNATSGVANANGVAIYFPYDRMGSVNKMAATYDKIGLDDAYTDCIKSFASVEVAGQTAAGGSSAQLGSLFGSLTGSGSGGSGSFGSSGLGSIGSLLGGLLGGDGRSLANVDLDAAQAEFIDRDLVLGSTDYLESHRFDPSALKWTIKNGHNVLALSEEQWSLVQTAELNVFADIGTGYIDLGLDNVFDWDDDGNLIGEYDRTWLSVNGQIVAYYLMSAEGTADDYQILGRIPAMLNGRLVNLIVSFTDENEDGEILGAAICYDGETETETLARGLVELQQGDRVDFVYSYYDYDRNLVDNYCFGDTLLIDGAITIGNIHMNNSDYIATYRINDIYNNSYWTPSFD